MHQIYKITNNINGKIYIGRTKRGINTRLSEHFRYAANGSQSCLYNSIRKYGKENFTIEVIDDNISQTDIFKRETFWILRLNCIAPNGMNEHSSSSGGCANISEDLRKRLSDKKKEYFKTHTQHNKGIPCSEEQKEKQRLKMKGRKLSESHKEKIRNKTCGREYSFISPAGEIHTFRNLNEFCKINKLTQSLMCMVSNEKLSQHKGWKLYK